MASPKTTSTQQKQPGVRVRMYRQGLGDCFLLTFPGDQRDFHMLIDCGVLKGTEKADEIMERVAGDIKTTTNGRLDLVVATHEHWDHLSGYLQAQHIFDQIEIRAVWLAWTEDPADRLAQTLREEREARAKALRAAVARMATAGFQETSAIEQILDFFGDAPAAPDGNPLAAAGGQTTKAALNYISTRHDATISYLRPGQQPALDGVEGVRVYVLGPPEDETLLKHSDPTKKGQEVYEEMAGLTIEASFSAALSQGAGLDGDESGEAMHFPFDAHYRISAEAAQAGAEEGFYIDHHGFAGAGDDRDAWRRIDVDWLGVAGGLALALDSDTNNTSLALAVELVDSGKVLLFPADAQVGNWESWERCAWSVPDAQGQLRTVTSNDLLRRTVLYKVGHHGSHNATLRTKGLELMESPELVALIPVNQEMAQHKKWSMPFPPLLRRLRQKTRGRVVIADTGLPQRADTAGLLTDEEWSRFNDAVKQTDLFIDWTVP